MLTDLTEDRRRTIFLNLVQAQDAGADVPTSRQIVAAKHGIDEDEVKQIARLGLDNEWPPLDELGAVGPPM